MTNRVLLELAAKAVGIDKQIAWGFDSVDFPYWLNDPKQAEPRYWNPIKNDGDAFVLAATLRMNVNITHSGTNAIKGKMEHYELTSGSEQKYGDRYLATRLAIVKLAARIGEEMK